MGIILHPMQTVRENKLIIIKKNTVLCLLLIIACILSAFPVNAQSLEDKRKDYEDQQENAEANKNTAAELVEEIKEVNSGIAELSQEIERTNDEIDEIDKEIEISNNNLIEIEDKISVARTEMGNALSEMYESMNTDDSLAMMLNADDLDDLINQDEYVDSYSAYINSKISELETIMNSETTQTEALKSLKDDKELALENLEGQRKELSKQMDELSSLMEEAKERAESAEAFAEQLKTEVLALEAAQREILGARGYDGTSSGISFSGDGTEFYYSTPYPYDDYELTLLAGIIEAEAGSVSYEGMVAVGSVVMNRVESPNFANTIEGVVYAPYQFEPAETGILAVILARGPATSCYQVAQEVLDGKRNVPNYYFKAAWYAEQYGIEGVNIGGNVFH